MATLLVLGSKPDPVLPPAGSFDAVACANASGRSAAACGLPRPVLTVMSALLTDGSPAAAVRLQALAGLSTERLIYYPRPDKRGSLTRTIRSALRNWRLKPFVLRAALRRVGYGYDRFVSHPSAFYNGLILKYAGGGAALERQLAHKQASSGVMALVMGIADGRFDRFVVSGFSFELTQAFGHDPNIELRGTARSLHRDSDLAVLRALAARFPVFTTEAVVHAAAGLPLLDASSSLKATAAP